MIGLLGGLVGDRINRVHVVIVVVIVTFVKLLVVSKEQVFDDRFNDASTDDKLERVHAQVHVRM
jgi:nitrate/nitrite transporter NarK